MKAVIYCRVSTEDEVQVNALEMQITEARDAVHKNGWELVDEYIDEGKSGTTTKRRKEYNRLIDDLEIAKFDVIVVKSQDRLMRSAKDWYVFIDKLIANKKKLYFYLEKQFYSLDDTLITGIKAILAEEYSRDLSKKMNNMHRHRQENKGTVLLTSNTWGYDKVNKNVVINEKEAEIVREIFNLYLEGFGIRRIANKLNKKGVRTRNGNELSTSTITAILKNPLFKGTQIMNRFHYDFNTKRSEKIPESEWIYYENAVPAIVDATIWDAVNERMKQKHIVKTQENNITVTYGKHTGKHPLSGKIFCGECGSVYWLRSREKKNGYSHYWYCSKYFKHGRKTKIRADGTVESREHGCDNIKLKTSELEKIMVNLIPESELDKEGLMNAAIEITQTLRQNQIDTMVAEWQISLNNIKEKRKKLNKMIAQGLLESNVAKRKDNKLLEEELELEIKIETGISSNDIAEVDNRFNNIIKEIRRYVETELPAKFFSEHVKRILVSNDKIEIEFDYLPKKEIGIKYINDKNYEFIL